MRIYFASPKKYLAKPKTVLGGEQLARRRRVETGGR
jgi:hypothetical protein